MDDPTNPVGTPLLLEPLGAPAAPEGLEATAWSRFTILARPTRAPVGAARHGPVRDGEVEIDGEIAPDHRGRGLAAEAAAELVDRVFADPAVRRVIAHPHEGPATRVLARLGFVRDDHDGRWTRDRHGADGFLGAWELDPARCAYEAGDPPRDGRYVLAPRPDGVAFTVDWTDPTGAARHVAFETVFGERDGLAMERPAPDTLITRASAGPITFASRTLTADRRGMRISQEGRRSDGTPFANVSHYVRIAWSWHAR